MGAFDQVLPVLAGAGAKAGHGVSFSGASPAARQAARQPVIVD